MNVSLAQAAAALNANSRWQEMISENLASSSVPGFRRQDMSFQAVQAGFMGPTANQWSPVMMPKAEAATIFETGESNYTGLPTNVALEGTGFFELQLADGSLAYTRSGEFKVNSQGELVSGNGFPVMGDAGTIELDPKNPLPLSIAASGTISQGMEIKGRLKAVDFANPRKLRSIGAGFFAADDPSLTPITPEGTTFKQGFLEASNTTVTREMASLLNSMRTYEANQRVMQVSDERVSRVISEMGNPN